MMKVLQLKLSRGIEISVNTYYYPAKKSSTPPVLHNKFDFSTRCTVPSSSVLFYNRYNFEINQKTIMKLNLVKLLYTRKVKWITKRQTPCMQRKLWRWHVPLVCMPALLMCSHASLHNTSSRHPHHSLLLFISLLSHPRNSHHIIYQTLCIGVCTPIFSSFLYTYSFN